MRVALVPLTICLLALPVHAQYSGGTGESNDPYQIATAADLIALGETPADYDKHFILTADIDLDPNLPGRKVFDKAVIAPMRKISNPPSDSVFTGTFDGNSHVIYNLTIRGYDCLGLFGQLSSNAVITNLGLEAVEINGAGSFVGGLVGDNDGSISNSYSTGTVRGDSRIGGLVGLNSGNINNSYSTGVVSGYSSVGGLVGSIWRWDLTVSGSYQCRRYWLDHSPNAGHRNLSECEMGLR
jgi:hypothetical protein